MTLVFEWDASKARINLEKHGVSFEDAVTIFGDPRAITIESRIDTGEQRWVTIGLTKARKCVIVGVHTDRNNRIRIISARPASKIERSQYQGELT